MVLLITIGVVMLYSTGAFVKQDAKGKGKSKAKASEQAQLPAASEQGQASAPAATPATTPPTTSAKSYYIDGKNQFNFIRKQALWIVLGIIVATVAARTDYRLWERYWPSLFVITVILLAMVYGFTATNGSKRWIKIWGDTGFQPSELGKLTAVVFLASWFSRHAAEVKDFKKGIVIPCAVVGVIMGLIVFEVDLGTTALIGVTTLCIMFVAGSNFLHTTALVVALAASLWFAVDHIPALQGRKHRVEAFLAPDGKSKGVGMQQHEALIALGSGGVEGLGLGNGRQKMQFLPEAHTDFIFPMIGEELGLRFTLLIVSCYVVFIICGAYISIHARDRFGMLLGFGVVTLIGIQAAVNIGVTTHLFPCKGFPLPFISYGGSNLMLCFAGVGILLSIYRQGTEEQSGVVPTRLNSRVTPRI